VGEGSVGAPRELEVLLGPEGRLEPVRDAVTDQGRLPKGGGEQGRRRSMAKRIELPSGGRAGVAVVPGNQTGRNTATPGTVEHGRKQRRHCLVSLHIATTDECHSTTRQVLPHRRSTVVRSEQRKISHIDGGYGRRVRHQIWLAGLEEIPQK